jgi:hypothetical protein
MLGVELTEKELRNGTEFFFNNDVHQMNIGDDDIRQAKVWFDGSVSWATGFKIFFNGELIHSSKTFKSMKKRLDKLVADWSLLQDDEL